MHGIMQFYTPLDVEGIKRLMQNKNYNNTFAVEYYTAKIACPRFTRRHYKPNEVTTIKNESAEEKEKGCRRRLVIKAPGCGPGNVSLILTVGTKRLGGR